MSQLWLVRHGSTTWSERQRLQGWAPIGLSAHGVEEAHAIGRAAAERGIRRIVSSPLRRARQTALIVARYVAAPILISPALQELNYGEITGCTMDELRARHPRLADAWTRHPWRVRFTARHGALVDVAAALPSALTEMQCAGVATLGITHGHVIRVALTTNRELAPNDIWTADVPTGSFWHFEDDERSAALR